MSRKDRSPHMIPRIQYHFENKYSILLYLRDSEDNMNECAMFERLEGFNLIMHHRELFQIRFDNLQVKVDP